MVALTSAKRVFDFLSVAHPLQMIRTGGTNLLFFLDPVGLSC